MISHGRGDRLGIFVFAELGPFVDDQKLQLSGANEPSPNSVGFRFIVGWDRNFDFVSAERADHDFLGARWIHTSQQVWNNVRCGGLIVAEPGRVFSRDGVQVKRADHVDTAAKVDTKFGCKVVSGDQ